MQTAYFLESSTALSPADAVAALIVLEDGRYVMQLRDPKPGIFYPDHWGCFGGAVDPGERPLDALRRELSEELNFQAEAAQEFTRIDFDFSLLGHRKVYRIFYEVSVTKEAFGKFELNEGADIRAFEASELLVGNRVTPYDAFAVWLHCSRHRFARRGG